MKKILKARRFWLAAFVLVVVTGGLATGKVMSQEPRAKSQEETSGEQVNAVEGNFSIPDENRKCETVSDKKRFSIGGYEFLAPVKIIGMMYEENHVFVPFRSIACISPEDMPIDLVFLKILIPKPEFLKDHPLPESRLGFNVHANVAAISPEYDDAYERAIKDGILSKDIDIKSLPLEEGFYVLNYQPKKYLFIPEDRSFVTPSGNPVIFYCEPYAARIDNPLDCSTWSGWKGNVGLGISGISEEWVPKSKLKEFYHLAFDYVKSLEVTDSNSQPQGEQP